MALEKNNLPIAITQGIDTKGDPKQLQAGKFTTLENAVFLKTGQISKCNGYEGRFPRAGVNYIGCATLKNTLLTVANNDCYTYSTDLDESTYVGRYSNVAINKFNGINNTSNSCTAFDTSTRALVHVWEENVGGSSNIKYLVVDSRTNTMIYPETVLWTGGTGPQIVSVGDYFLVVFTDTAGVYNLQSIAISKSDYSDLKYAQLATGTAYTNFGFTLEAPGSAYIAWSSGSVPAAADSKIARFSSTFAGFGVPSIITLSGTSSKYGSAIAAFGANIMFAFCDQIDIKTIVYDTTLSTIVNPLRTAITRTVGTTFLGVVLQQLPNSEVSLFTTTLTGVLVTQLPKVEQAIINGTTTLVAKRNFVLGASIAGTVVRFSDVSFSEPFYLPVRLIQQFGPGVAGGYSGIHTLYLVEFYNQSYPNTAPPNNYVAAKFYDLNAQQLVNAPGHPYYIRFRRAVSGTTTVNYALVPEYAGNSSLCSIGLNGKPVFAELGNNLHVTGGYLGMFDGVEFAEHNFFQQPLQCYVTNAGAGTVAAGTYLYQITYEWQDATGQIHESAPSTPVSITLASASQVNVDCATVKLTNKTSDIFIAVYRSNDGILYYKLPGTGLNSAARSVKTSNTIAITDNSSQPNIIGNQLLYTSAGELDNASAPACSHVSVYKKRLIVVPSEDTNTFWYSKEIVPATSGAIGAPVAFATEFVQAVDERGGNVTGTAQLDDKLVIFKQSSISIVTGEGPAPNGLQNDFTTPQLIASDTGCLYGRSIVITPLGLMFQSPKGFYLCDRSINVSYLGAPIESFNSFECTSGTLLYDRNEVWFSLNTNYVIVFNYYFNQFSTFTYRAEHACIHKGVYVSVYASLINIETPGVYLRSDGGAPQGYAMKATTGWLSFAQVQGFQRVYKLLILGDYKSAHRLQVQVSVDFDDTVVQTSTITATATPPYQYRVFMTRQKCESIKFTIQDLAPTVGAWTEGYTFGNMAFEIGVKRGLNKLPASKSVG